MSGPRLTRSGKPDLRVKTSDANIHVDTWDHGTIEARVSTKHYKIGEGDIPFRVVEHQSGDSIQLEVHDPHRIKVIGYRRRRPSRSS
jgi:hypothetical protein